MVLIYRQIPTWHSIGGWSSLRSKQTLNNSYMSYKSYINNFNFPDPDWEKLPDGFFSLSKKGLTKEEGHLFDAIKLAYFANEGGWKKSAARIGLICLIGLIALISLISTDTEPLARTVSAATLRVDEVIQSTVSAILRR